MRGNTPGGNSNVESDRLIDTGEGKATLDYFQYRLNYFLQCSVPEIMGVHGRQCMVLMTCLQYSCPILTRINGLALPMMLDFIQRLLQSKSEI